MNLGEGLAEIRRHGRDAQWWRKRFLSHIVSRYYDLNPPERTPLVELDWDNVIILDACRFDLFAEVHRTSPLDGELSKRLAAESGTPGFLRENFAGRKFHDTVYVTANPYIYTVLREEQFHAVDHVWHDGWDAESGTVIPETMHTRATEAHERYPNKRLIVHFNQPHAPFIGEIELEGQTDSAIRQKALGLEPPDPRGRQRTPFEQLGASEVSREVVWNSYRSNLERAWPSVAALLETFKGLTAVTADHGNALGERAWPFPIRVYGHPLGILIPALLEVPWHLKEGESRKRIESEPPVDVQAFESDETAERLRMLGYVE